MVGTSRKNTNTGAAYLFEKDYGGSDNWGERKILIASDGATEDLFGKGVSISATHAMVGASKADGTAPDCGAPYIFERDQGGANNWGQSAKLTASDGAVNDIYSHDVSLSDDFALIGASRDSDDDT